MRGLAHREDYYKAHIQVQADQKMRQELETILALTCALPTEIPEEYYKLVEDMIWYLLVSPEMTELNDIQRIINKTFPGIRETLLIAAYREAIGNIFVNVLNGTLK